MKWGKQSALFTIVISTFLALFSTPGSCDQTFQLKNGKTLSLQVVPNDPDLNLEAEQTICVDSFLDTYKDIPLKELNPGWATWDDARLFYTKLCSDELKSVAAEGLTLIRALISDEPTGAAELVGWVTFENEPRELNAFYVSTLVVAPKFQAFGIGKHLLFSIKSDASLFPKTQTLYLVARKLNLKAIAFYQHLGFREEAYDHKDLLVEPGLLTSLKWTQKD